MLAENIKLENDERILVQTRKHWFILFAEVFFIFLGVLFPPCAYLFISGLPFGEYSVLFSYATPYVLFGYTAWLLLLWMVLFNMWTNYYLDIWIITNKRLIVVDQKGFFRRATGSFRLERLQDINVEINGVVATLLDFGTLEAQTAAGSEDEFRANGLPKPRELKSVILEASDMLMHEHVPHAVSRDGV